MSLKASELAPPAGATKTRKRIGRGNATGQGTYAGKGLKGQKSRSGKPIHLTFEGGQLPLVRRLGKLRGFNNKWRVEYQPINVARLDRFDAGTEITPALLLKQGIISNMNSPVKILGNGELATKLDVKAHAFSASARAKIEAAGGTATRVDEHGNPVADAPAPEVED